MAIKKYGPTTPGRRGMTVTDYSVLSKVAPERSLLEPMKKHSGRNNTGRITVRHQGGGNRTKYRVIDFKRQKTDMPATVKTLEYDPNRSAFIALVEYTDGTKSYIIAPDGLKVGDVVVSSKSADIKPGNCPSINMSIRTDSELKAQAEQVLSQLGMNMTGTINMFLQQIVRDRAVPLSLSLSSEQSLYADLLKARTEREQGVEYLSSDSVLRSIDSAIEKGSANG